MNMSDVDFCPIALLSFAFEAKLFCPTIRADGLPKCGRAGLTVALDGAISQGGFC
jgi:hypothetical protein